MTGNRTSFEQTLREQAQEGARMAREDEGDATIVYRGAPKRTIDLGAARRAAYGTNSAVKKEAKVKGHEAFLKALETSGTQVQFEKMSGEMVTGTIKHSDKYTITVRHDAGDGEVLNRVLFKHDISEFRALAPKPDEVEGTLQ